MPATDLLLSLALAPSPACPEQGGAQVLLNQESLPKRQRGSKCSTHPRVYEGHNIWSKKYRKREGFRCFPYWYFDKLVGKRLVLVSMLPPVQETKGPCTS